jgi:hypothetical protein
MSIKIKKREASIEGYESHNDKYFASPKRATLEAALPSGIYRIDFDHANKVPFLFQTELTHDDILDLPSPEYVEVMRTMNCFMTKEAREKYEQLGYLYKRNIIIHGVPGSGKTIMVNKIAERAVTDKDAICLFIDRKTISGVPGLSLLESVIGWLKDTNPDSLLVIILEEVDEMIESNEHQLLVFLDGQNQRPNTIVLGTTNYINKVPARFLRPGRFSQQVEVLLPGEDARRHYLVAKLGAEFAELDLWVKETSEFSIDELKEVIQSCFILGEEFFKVRDRILKTKGMGFVQTNTNLIPTWALNPDGWKHDQDEL